MTDTLIYKLAFASVRGINPRLATELLRMLGSEQAFFEASETQLHYITQSKAKIYNLDYRQQLLEKAAAESTFIASNHIRPLYYTDPEYPHRLADCDDAPAMLYTLGNCDMNQARILGIVGTRHASIYGISFTERLVEELAQSIDGLVIVSGLAYGIDIAAHRAAMRCGVPTIAVLAHGLDTIYPAPHRHEAADIARRGGALVTEYSKGTRPLAPYFLARNR
ncbi:MAG: DNA-protecting protein DprA, partial [Muribaculaceae bacterium]|nr:DNA-protecting protein DprA [Muribaculaceae bacterium]